MYDAGTGEDDCRKLKLPVSLCIICHVYVLSVITMPNTSDYSMALKAYVLKWN